ncbi:MARVEL domain-containing protein 3-like [Eublepharis macularius]|uniref:MARVEL domain-containing protein 3-like n=1 Tax=Eublepharis macularius TaxID=481883 RepID=A0AA97L4T2_EUBMA|nr:MARVEL domain-containing protein 3-like [Eublepharis macularius]
MSRSERPHRDKDYRRRENPTASRYIEERSRKPYPSNGRTLQASLYSEHSRPPTVFADSLPKYPAPSHVSAEPSAEFYPPKETFSEKCSNLCSRRGILQFVEIIVSILVLICIGASQAAISGFSAMGGLGSFSIDSSYSPFEGTELKEVRDLDMQYSQMRAPCVYGGVAFSLTMMALTLLFLITGGKPIHRLSVRLLVAECIFDVLACLGYIVAVGLYLHFVIQINSTDVCKRRERVYARRGYTWMNCEVQGGDAAVALFGLVAACLYFPSAVVCILSIRSVKEFKREVAKTQYNLERNYREENHRNVYKSPESCQTAKTFATLV